ncbi:MAG: hypothetical protein JST70_05000 [Bacteroidetes bacterium]|nr:hypothetical protein [Bacteroidota bacterium]
MSKETFIFFIFFVFAAPSWAQKQNYNCVILDSIINKIQLRKAQNDFLLPLFRSGDVKTDGYRIYRTTQDKIKSRRIDSLLSKVDTIEREWFLNDTLFSLDTFNIIIDTFGFFDNTCNVYNGCHYLVVNDYGIIKQLKKTCNAIVVEYVGYNGRGGLVIAMRNTKSEFVIIFIVEKGSILYPRISILGRYLFDPIEGIIIE